VGVSEHPGPKLLKCVGALKGNFTFSATTRARRSDKAFFLCVIGITLWTPVPTHATCCVRATIFVLAVRARFLSDDKHGFMYHVDLRALKIEKDEFVTFIFRGSEPQVTIMVPEDD
jgi:hypothetical protein